MRHKLFKTFAFTGAAVLLLSGCSLLGDDSGGDQTAEDPVYAEMSTWNACEVLDNLQPVTDYMGIKGYGSLSSEGGEPGNSELGNTWDPDALGCNGLIFLGSYEGAGVSGEIQVKIVPTENEEQAEAAFSERTSAAQSQASEWTDIQSTEFGEPWDQGALYSWTGDADQPNLQAIARDGQWVFHFDVYHSQDWGVTAGADPILPHTTEELSAWLVDEYLPSVNQIVNDRIAEVQ